MPASCLSLIEPFLLANAGLLRKFEEKGIADILPHDDVKEEAYLEYRKPRYAQPSHIFRQRWEAFTQYGASEENWVLPALERMRDEFLDIRGDRICVKIDQFSRWQTLISRISATPLIALSLVNRISSRRHSFAPPKIEELQKLAKEVVAASPLLSPRDEEVEEYIETEGLNETHVHLNGSTFSEFVWLNTLRNPQKNIQAFSQKYRQKREVQELCHTIDPLLNPQRLRTLLKTARVIRGELMQFAIEEVEPFCSSIQENPTFYDFATLAKKPPNMTVDRLLRKNPSSEQYHLELAWMARLFIQLKNDKPRPFINRLLHSYLLIMNLYYQMLVQRDDLYGFDEFQKLTLTSMRDNCEKEFYERFMQAHGTLRKNPSRIDWYEGRKSIKESAKKEHASIMKILEGYSQYLEEGEENKAGEDMNIPRKKWSRAIFSHLDKHKANYPKREVKLALIGHFIKQKEAKTNAYRHVQLRNKLEKQTSALLSSLRRSSQLKMWFRGIDAAANELHTPPEVFAPFFRVCRYEGIERATYHVGEDFIHIIGGIRHIADAVKMLELRSGDRLGHATALGINPKKWIETVPSKIYHRKDEWMLDLLWAWKVLRDAGGSHAIKWANKAEEQAMYYAQEFFLNDAPCNMRDLERLMSFRDLYPRFLFLACQNKDGNNTAHHVRIHNGWNEEMKKVNALCNNPKDKRFAMLMRDWFSAPEILKESKKIISVDSNFFPAEALVLLQQHVLNILNEKTITIETLPTSNIRIAQYNQAGDHHALRWMKTEKYALENDPPVRVSFGSDDPGIFATNLSNEFYHLYHALKKEMGLPSQEAIQRIGKLNKTGKTYRFHNDKIK